MKRILTKMKELTRIPLVGQTEAGSAEAQPARDSQLNATNCRWDGSLISAIPFYELQRQFRALLCLKKPPCQRQGSLLTVKRICPIHAEPVHACRKASCGLAPWRAMNSIFSVFIFPKIHLSFPSVPKQNSLSFPYKSFWPIFATFLRIWLNIPTHL